MKLQDLSFKKAIEAVKPFSKSKYSVVAVASVLTFAMLGSIGVLAMNKKSTPQTLVARGFNQIPPTPLPIVASSTPAISPTAPAAQAPTVTATPTQTTIPTPTPTIDPMASWHLYTNSQYGYSIKYPTDWKVQDLGALEQLVPSYIVFNLANASASARSITVSVSLRPIQDQLAIEGQVGSSITVASIAGKQMALQDSDGTLSRLILLPRASNLLLLHAVSAYASIFNQMLQTLKFTN